MLSHPAARSLPGHELIETLDRADEATTDLESDGPASLPRSRS